MNPPKLQNYDEFKTILENYHISDEAQNLLDQLRLVLLISPTSAGRNTIIKELVKSGEYEYIVSDTTRPKRINNGEEEKDGQEYHFKSEEEFITGLRAKEYLEAEIIHEQQVSGISMSELERVCELNKIAIDEMEIRGAARMSKVMPAVHTIFVLPPTYEEWMTRLRKRGHMHQEEMLNRLKSAEKEFIAAIENDYYKFVINADLAVATQKIREIVEENTYSAEDHKAGQDLAWKLLNQVKQELYS